MKKGKSCVLKGYNKMKCNYGTVDSKNFKSIYLNIQSWVEPKNLETEWKKYVSNLLKLVKNSINENINIFIFEPKFIVDLDLRTSGISYGKRSFMNIEITFFVKSKIDFKSIELKNELKKIISIIDVECFRQNSNFDFYLTKNIKSNKLNIA